MIDLGGVSTNWFKNHFCPSIRLSRLRALSLQLPVYLPEHESDGKYGNREIVRIRATYEDPAMSSTTNKNHVAKNTLRKGEGVKDSATIVIYHLADSHSQTKPNFKRYRFILILDLNYPH